MFAKFTGLPLSVALLFTVFGLTALRSALPRHLPIWLLVSVAAMTCLVFLQIDPQAAYRAINFDVVFYLFGVFVIAQGLEDSQLLTRVLLSVLQRMHQKKYLLLVFILGTSCISLLLMNDTAAIIGVPVILVLSKQTNVPPLPLLLTLAFTVTLSSVASPVGNPQNLLIASHLQTPFVTFIRHLFIPTLINVALLYGYILAVFKDDFSGSYKLSHQPESIDKPLAKMSLYGLIIMLILLGYNIICALFELQCRLAFSSIALLGASPLLLFSQQRLPLLKRIDWHTLIFFMGLFVLMKSVWLSGFFQQLMHDGQFNLHNKLTLLLSSLSLSQLISNVPLVAFFLPLLQGADEASYLLLAMASTMAGNLLIFGAASNVIIIQNCEKRRIKPFSFVQFFIYGAPITVVQVLVYWFFGN